MLNNSNVYFTVSSLLEGSGVLAVSCSIYRGGLNGCFSAYLSKYHRLLSARL